MLPLDPHINTGGSNDARKSSNKLLCALYAVKTLKNVLFGVISVDDTVLWSKKEGAGGRESGEVQI